MSDEYKKYACDKCNYRFRFRVNTKKALRCPYCGNDNVSEDKFDLNKLVDSM